MMSSSWGFLSLFLERASLRRLGELEVLLDQHLSLEFLQDGLDGVVAVPPGEDGNSTGIDLEGRVQKVNR